jgi:hypothetical protein
LNPETEMTEEEFEVYLKREITQEEIDEQVARRVV